MCTNLYQFSLKLRSKCGNYRYKYGFNCAEFCETLNYAISCCGCLLYRLLPRLNEREKIGKNFFLDCLTLERGTDVLLVTTNHHCVHILGEWRSQNIIYALQWSMKFTTSIFTKLTSAQQCYMGIFYVVYVPRKVESTGINFFKFLNEATAPIWKKITFLPQYFLK
jgi:hypothetical protein